MTPRRDPVPRARNPWQWLGGLLVLGILAGALVAAALLLWENVDIRRLAGAPGPATEWAPPEPVGPSGPASPQGSSFSAALFRSAATASFFPDTAHYPGILRRWEALAREAGAESVDVVEDAAGIAALEPGTLLLAPAAVCLSTGEADALGRHLERGGALLLTWATGARDGSCDWAGWDALASLTGSTAIRQLESRPTTYLTVPGGLPVGAGLDPGTRIELRWDAQVALSGPGPRIYWSDWAMNPEPADGESGVDASAWFGRTEGGGRVLWFGFSGAEGARPADQERLDVLLRGGLLWAAGLPTAELLPWPGGAQGALMVAQDVEAEFGNTSALASLARENGFPVTFFVLSRLALDYPHLADVLRTAGEVGSQTSDHAVVAGLPEAEQLARLRRSWTEMRGWTGDSARGFRPPEERYDEGTLRAWRSLGGTYLVAVNDARGASPELFATPSGPVVLLPRILKDDYNVLVQEGRMATRHLVDAWLRGMDKVRALGGLAVISLHSQVAGTPRRVGAVAQVVDSARSQGDWWVATGGEIADWWTARHGAEVEVSDEGSGLTVRVTAGERPLEDPRIGLYLPDGLAGRTPAVEGTPVAYRETPWGISVAVGRVPPGETRTLTLEAVPDP